MTFIYPMHNSNLTSSHPNQLHACKTDTHSSVQSISHHFFPASSFKLTILFRITFSAVLSLSSAK
jgi:hypothetical protein